MCDARDTIFQRDPFDWTHFKASQVTDLSSNLVYIVSVQVGGSGEGPAFIDEQLYIILENSALTINTQVTNADWVNAVYGEAGLARIGGKFRMMQ